MKEHYQILEKHILFDRALESPLLESQIIILHNRGYGDYETMKEDCKNLINKFKEKGNKSIPHCYDEKDLVAILVGGVSRMCMNRRVDFK